MDVSHILDSLNPAQREAVTAPLGSGLVLAGAGSGKTRVLTHRIAWLIQTQGLSPFSILAVTFTNKAAAEMRARIESLLQVPLRGMWVGTFHSLAHRFLRAHWRDADLDQNFQIIDADDQLRLVKRVMAGLNLDDKKWPAKQAVWWINAQKDEGLRPAHIEDFGDLYVKTQLSVYRVYEEACQRGGMVDFAELLLRTHETLLKQPALLKHYQERFAALLVDEFQDTNGIQYAWLRILAGERNNLMVVGDDDQSIYGWRGAKIENIQRFQDDFPDFLMVRLEQNYRSTNTILGAANSLIMNNSDRLGKQLWTEDGQGDAISLYAAYNEIDEARYIVERIKQWFADGNGYSEAAILYRSNAQSRVLEEALLRSQMPYRIYGGQRFFERAEIRTALAYIRLVNQRDADAAFERVVNLPARGIGGKNLEQIRGFENLAELVSAARTFDPDDNVMFDPDARAEMTVVDEFLGHAALEAGEGQGQANEDCVQLMTMHSAKGLEFPVVFLAGLEEGLFPHNMSLEEPGRLEEERRLCYVGVTRAMRKLYITYAESRRLNGSENYNQKSRFITEIPAELIQEVRLQDTVVRPAYQTSHKVKRIFSEVEGTDFALGQRVMHAKFGEGVILNYEGAGKQARVQVKFDQVGSKWLMLSFANLQAIG